MDHKLNKLLVNLISQVANLSAQKKIGSNFDISTAVFGTHLYKNVIPHVAFNCLHDRTWTSLT
jgi:phosphomevalonate kinase